MSVGLQDQQAAKRLEELRAILLSQDRASQATVMERLAELEAAIVDDEAFAERLEPHLVAQVAHLQEHFPRLFGQFMGPAIKRQIEEEREVIIEALYPIIGRLIARFIKEEISRISQRIDESLRDPFSLKNIKLRVQALFTGVTYEELLFRDLANRHRLEEIFIIQKPSGLALARYSLNEVTNAQMVAGMLTGIKDFMEHAFRKEGQELETLTYDRYLIQLYPYPRYYIATVIEGSPDVEYQRFLRQQVQAFCANAAIQPGEEVTKAEQARLSDALKQHFDGFNQRNQ